MNISTFIIKTILKERVTDLKKIDNIKRQATLKYKKTIPTNIELLQAYHELLAINKIKKSINLEALLKTRKIRTLSGIAAITVITKPFHCPGKCIYCPNEKNMPKSYLPNEPACMRALLTNFDPYKQVNARLNSLKITGHTTDKIELIVLGGTWSYYPKKYQTWFIKKCFDACNGKKSKTLKSAQKLNETAKNRIVGLTLETRPDFITKKEIKRMRWLGCTRVELGVQIIDEKILKKNKRKMEIKTIKRATELLKNAGFKVTYHIMLNLPGSNIKKDEEMFIELFSNPGFKPDQLKIYPCVVLKTAPLYKKWKEKKYKPYSKKNLINLLISIKQKIPSYVRIIRIIRDIPSQSIIAGNKIPNLRQVIQKKMEKLEKHCQCIRCREIKNEKSNIKNVTLKRLNYNASNGKEIFLSFEDAKQNKVMAFLRLRITNNWSMPVLKNCALIREIHTYGQTLPISNVSKKAHQHKKMGKNLIKQAEKIVKKETNLKKIAVISGIGVREYYKKLGYKLKSDYMIKKI